LTSCLFYAPQITVIYTLSLHDALPIYGSAWRVPRVCAGLRKTFLRHTQKVAGGIAQAWTRPRAGDRRSGSGAGQGKASGIGRDLDRKSTRLNSSHLVISYAVFCLKKKK